MVDNPRAFIRLGMLTQQLQQGLRVAKKEADAAMVLQGEIDEELHAGQDALDKALTALTICKSLNDQLWKTEYQEYEWVCQNFNDRRDLIRKHYKQLAPNTDGYAKRYQELQRIFEEARYFIRDTPGNFLAHLNQQHEYYAIKANPKVYQQAKELAKVTVGFSDGNVHAKVIAAAQVIAAAKEDTQEIFKRYPDLWSEYQEIKQDSELYQRAIGLKASRADLQGGNPCLEIIIAAREIRQSKQQALENELRQSLMATFAGFSH